jgi:hypothetical protein
MSIPTIAFPVPVSDARGVIGHFTRRKSRTIRVSDLNAAIALLNSFRTEDAIFGVVVEGLRQHGLKFTPTDPASFSAPEERAA